MKTAAVFYYQLVAEPMVSAIPQPFLLVQVVFTLMKILEHLARIESGSTLPFLQLGSECLPGSQLGDDRLGDNRPRR